MRKELVAVIPVKANSERVKEKNIRSFGDTTLLDLKLKQVTMVKGFDDVVVSSESDEVLERAIKYGVSVHHRDPQYSTSMVPMSDVYSYIASEVNGENIAWVNVTNPLAEHYVYEKAIDLYQNLESGYDGLVSVTEVRDYLLFRGKPVNFSRAPWARSQDLEPLLSVSFVINILKRQNMISWGSCVGENPFFYVLDQTDAWDIDEKRDFDFCEEVYLRRKNGVNSRNG